MTNIKSLIKNWYISYNPYSDLFQIYDDIAFHTAKKDLLEKKKNKIRVLINKNSSLPILLEITSAYDVLGVDIDNLEKKDIINLVAPYIQHYA
ncbi:MAG: hypothetical protein M1426_04835 [Patescibacteria group bacterium]|nr:hypothetical protein [Patescibacteria group bacterium]